jgi:hypothetical protein
MERQTERFISVSSDVLGERVEWVSPLAPFETVYIRLDEAGG